MRIALFVLLALPCVLPASADTLTGAARIIDADTVEIAGEKLRLEGIDAPESRQTCKRAGKRYDCGKEATSALRVKIGKAFITCKGDSRDQYDRLIAVCYLDDMDLNGWLVRQGKALGWTDPTRRLEYNKVRPHSALGYRLPAPEATLPLLPGSAPAPPGCNMMGSQKTEPVGM